MQRDLGSFVLLGWNHLIQPKRQEQLIGTHVRLKRIGIVRRHVALIHVKLYALLRVLRLVRR